MFNIGNIVRRIVPDTGLGCVGIVENSVIQDSFSREEFGYVLVRITEGNDFYPVDSVTGWFFGSVELIQE